MLFTFFFYDALFQDEHTDERDGLTHKVAELYA